MISIVFKVGAERHLPIIVFTLTKGACCAFSTYMRKFRLIFCKLYRRLDRARAQSVRERCRGNATGLARWWTLPYMHMLRSEIRPACC